MRPPLQALGFDLDYTLWDHDRFLLSFFEAVAGDLGARLGCGRERVTAVLRGCLERLTPAHPGLFDAALDELGAWDADLVVDLVARYRRHRPPAALYPGALAALAQLRATGRPLFLVTDGHGPTQRRKVQALGLAPWFAHMVFTGDYPPELRKPSPFPFLAACGRLGVDPGRCAYVGDNPRCDFQGPRSLGMLTVGVGTGPFAALATPPGEPPSLRIAALAELRGLL